MNSIRYKASPLIYSFVYVECIIGVANFQDVTASGRALQCGPEGLRGGEEGAGRGPGGGRPGGGGAGRDPVTSHESRVVSAAAALAGAGRLHRIG
ncbi:unnamed protein product [Danaus chrysippus]|uniref:(African queen) hypothetical protein n=1 Tax=Danaus chrysippus TaxID=151541 RepID=A0A8J2VXU1_9NEOP|nr:unnamed protein product [Danaus chrysippus]